MSYTRSSLTYVWNNDSMKSRSAFGGQQLDDDYRIERRAFLLRVEVAGSNVEPVETTIRAESWFPGFRILGSDNEPFRGSA
jgi:hypothetical protein